MKRSAIRGKYSICSRRIRILHIAMNEHEPPRRPICQSMQRGAVENAPVVVLSGDIVRARYSRRRGKVD
jgi:hypothetical protein